MIKLELSLPTLDAAAEAIQRLQGIEVVIGETVAGAPTPNAHGVTSDGIPAFAKTEKKKGSKKTQQSDAATTAGFAATKPAATKSKVPTVDETKAAILAWAGEGDDAPGKMKEFVRGFGVKKVIDMSDEIRVQAVAKLAELSAADEEAEAEDEDDPMA